MQSSYSDCRIKAALKLTFSEGSFQLSAGLLYFFNTNVEKESADSWCCNNHRFCLNLIFQTICDVCLGDRIYFISCGENRPYLLRVTVDLHRMSAFSVQTSRNHSKVCSFLSASRISFSQESIHVDYNPRNEEKTTYDNSNLC